MKVLVTGAEGFIGKNLVIRLGELQDFEVIKVVRSDSEDVLRTQLANADAVIHLAGENRPKKLNDFHEGNAQLTKKICRILSELQSPIPILLSSSTQANQNNDYGKSKKLAEISIEQYSKSTGISAAIYRLPGVFGKWCKPNYNSVVATFCHNVAHGLPNRVDDSDYQLKLVYIDDVIDSFIKWLKEPFNIGLSVRAVDPEYIISLGELAGLIEKFPNSRKSLVSEPVGTGFLRALYSTYLSYLPTDKFEYTIPCHGDERGVFVEMLKTKDSGQFSFFTAHPGITRGGHYHHTKTEKFLVIKGTAKFRFRHILTNEVFDIDTSGKTPTIIETIPGWSHDITNNGDDELIVMLWANEIFDKDKPDTIASEI
ncbi:MAG: NAD-dependent epimerase/dehydratase family protein [Candidatus Neomarinimicrobiota bacterium]